MNTIKNVKEAEAALKVTPFMYLISFFDAEGLPGSDIIASPEKLPLWKVYFMMNEVNSVGLKIIINNIVALND